MLFNHSAWSWNKNLLVLINTPVVKPLCWRKPNRKYVRKTHNTGKIAQNNSSQLICMDILIMKIDHKENTV